MRTKEEIDSYLKALNSRLEDQFIIELLLDIRELLQEANKVEENVNVCPICFSDNTQHDSEKHTMLVNN